MLKDLNRVYSLKGNVLFKTARESIHFLRKPPAIAIDLEIFNGDYKVINDTYDVFDDSYFEEEIE